jgi:hypothetical protein
MTRKIYPITGVICGALISAMVLSADPVPVVTGITNDYAPTIARQGNRLWIAFECQDATWLNGDIYITYSDDWGETWEYPAEIITGPGNHTLASLVFTNDTFHLFYSLGEINPYGIYKATSTDGLTWVEGGEVDLGWAVGDQVDPTVSLDLDGNWGMVYNNLGDGVYFAQSLDGRDWDKDKRRIAAGERPRACVDKGNLWHAVMQQNVGGYAIAEYTSEDGITWVQQNFLTLSNNNHDPFIGMLADSTLCCFYSKVVGPGYDIYRRVQDSSGTWLPEEAINSEQGYQTQSHFVTGDSGSICLAYAHSTDITGATYDIYFERIPGPIGPDTVTHVSQEVAPATDNRLKIKYANNGIVFRASQAHNTSLYIYECTGALADRLVIRDAAVLWRPQLSGVYFARLSGFGAPVKFIAIK